MTNAEKQMAIYAGAIQLVKYEKPFIVAIDEKLIQEAVDVAVRVFAAVDARMDKPDLRVA